MKEEVNWKLQLKKNSWMTNVNDEMVKIKKKNMQFGKN